MGGRKKNSTRGNGQYNNDFGNHCCSSHVRCEGEWWGHFKDGSLNKDDILSMKETDWYQKDLFGLKTVDERGGIIFNSTNTDHMGFTLEEVVWWIDNYFEE